MQLMKQVSKDLSYVGFDLYYTYSFPEGKVIEFLYRLFPKKSVEIYYDWNLFCSAAIFEIG